MNSCSALVATGGTCDSKFLVRFAGEQVEVSKKRGRKRLAFDEELVAALDHTRGDSRNPQGA